MSASSTLNIKSFVSSLQDLNQFQKFNWEGSFQQYVDLIREKPEITRNAFQRLFDLITSYGTEEYVEFKKKITSYNFRI